MRCGSCGHEHQADGRFCSQCGAALHPACPACGAACEPGAKFCSACGQSLLARPGPRPDARPSVPAHLAEKIQQARAELTHEPRTVTILFVDTVNSMAGVEGLDLEALHAVVQERTQLMADAVHEYEGTVLQFLGDGIMAVFGAPIAHEDSARRAVAAAAAMRDGLAEHARAQEAAGDPAFTYRFGLNTGPVIVGGIGDDLSMDYLAIGDTVNLAARMEQAASPGAIYVTAATQYATTGYFEFRDVGPLTVKGKPEPLAAYAVERELGARTRFEVAQLRGLTPLVGRDTELTTLRNYFAEAVRGAGQVVSLIGEAGIGKSRLVMEFRSTLVGEPHQWFAGQCIPYGRTMPYLPIVDIVKESFGIDDSDDEPAICEKVAAGVAGWERPAQASAPYLRYLLAVDPGDDAVRRMDAYERHAGILGAIRVAVEEQCRELPLVLVIEDLHWMDERSGEAVRALVDAVAALPVLLLLTARPGYPTAVVERAHVSRVAVRALTDAAAAAVARGVLRSDDLPEELCAQISAKADGNPFYVEEVTRHLVEAGILEATNGSYRLTRPPATDDIPTTVQEVIRARMDRLEPLAREALQISSVIGREFTGRLLARIADLGDQVSGVLQELKDVELVLEAGYFPEAAYMFKHALTCDVAYESLLTERRRVLHCLIASAIEELYADRLTEHYGTLAHHWYEGQDWPRALDYLCRAAEQAVARYANPEALELYTRALDVCPHLAEAGTAAEQDILQRQAQVYQIISDWEHTVAVYRRVLALAREHADREAEGFALTDLGLALFWNHRLPEAKVLAQDAVDIAAELESDAVRGRALTVLALLERVGGNTRDALTMLPDAVELTARTGQADWANRARFLNALNLCWQGRFDESLAEWPAEELTERPVVITNDVLQREFVRGMALAARGRYADALTVLLPGITLSQRVGEKLNQARVWNTVGWIHGELYDWARAIEYNERALSLIEFGANDEIWSNIQCNLGDAALATGDVEKARHILETLDGQIPGFNELSKWRYSQHCFHSLGKVLFAVGEVERALEFADRCLDIAQETEAGKNITKARRLRAQIFLAQNRPADAEPELQAALEAARRVANPPQLWKTLETLGRLRSAQGRADDARAAFSEAVAVIEDVAEALTDDELREIFLHAPEVQALRDAAGAA